MKILLKLFLIDLVFTSIIVVNHEDKLPESKKLQIQLTRGNAGPIQIISNRTVSNVKTDSDFEITQN